ncbi:transcriptional regulator, DeoR family [Quadrisphaera granulorum]|uniref:DeoR family transcriptional regulator n=1 Tax=Quadrisphaera granulorum TaxID=317664 RepID=A0A315ZQU4_9ACTN|nr:DeoR/GlpR family DNA-binding transcription regulator [Quadrisphaera granulorum]PWJ47278.1 DeoR family transcriptional regulator [Quadrisphaera granulorum]SZE98849.1 transcriptional regulator, DeoR family [Quadrisphaera granulorum]
MLARQRQERILEEVRAHGGARVSDLVTALGVSEMTVRRDITILAGQGLVARVHGGATALSARAEEPGFTVKSALALPQKEAIARAAAELVAPGSSVAISAGTTTHAVASALVDVPGLTVVTNSLRVEQVLHEAWSAPDWPDSAPAGGAAGSWAGGAAGGSVVLTGGERTPSDALVGPVAVAAIRSLHVDTLLLGVHGVDLEAGLTTPNLVEGETNRALVASARHVVVVCDSSKWHVVGLASIAPLDAVDVLVTDDGLPHAAREVLASKVGRLVIAERDAATG